MFSEGNANAARWKSRRAAFYEDEWGVGLGARDYQAGTMESLNSLVTKAFTSALW